MKWMVPPHFLMPNAKHKIKIHQSKIKNSNLMNWMIPYTQYQMPNT